MEPTRRTLSNSLITNQLSSDNRGSGLRGRDETTPPHHERGADNNDQQSVSEQKQERGAGSGDGRSTDTWQPALPKVQVIWGDARLLLPHGCCYRAEVSVASAMKWRVGNWRQRSETFPPSTRRTPYDHLYRSRYI